MPSSRIVAIGASAGGVEALKFLISKLPDVLPGRVYVAPPDEQMMVEGATLRLTRTAKENHTRTAREAGNHDGAKAGEVEAEHISNRITQMRQLIEKMPPAAE